MSRLAPYLAAAATLLAANAALAGLPRVEKVRLTESGDGRFTIAVTLSHADSGWDHYADRWEVLGPDDKVLAARVLYHPHVDEQPFTRALSGVKLAPNIRFLRIRPHDKRHGFGPVSAYIEVPGRELPPKCRPGQAGDWLNPK